MKRLILTVILLGMGFGAGVWFQSRPKPEAPKERKVLYWVDAMHPWYKSDKPGIAPDCGMKLEPVYEEPAKEPAQGHAAHAMPSTSDMPSTVEVSAEKQQLIGVRVGTAEFTPVSRTIHATGRAAIDETRVTHVHTRVDGFIEKVFADFTGKFVEKGAPLATVYSPDIFATQQEYLLAVRGRTQLARSTIPGVDASMSRMADAARRRLELWNFPSAQIADLERTGQPIRTITVTAPASGYITERRAFPNLAVKSDTDLYTLADLSRVWILASVFEQDAAAITPNAVAELTAGQLRFWGKVTYLQPAADPATRTVTVRLEADSPKMALLPGMFVEVDFRLHSGTLLTVPSEAVLDSGDHQRVFLDKGDGKFEPRQVETGERAGDRIVIRRGLSSGDRIVISGNFLLDSETQLRK